MANIEETRIRETEVEPNRFTVQALSLVTIAFLIACVLNQVGVFDVNKLGIWICFAISFVLCVVANVLVRNDTYVRHPGTKCFVMLSTIVITFGILVDLNISAELFLFFPFLISTRYRSLGITLLAFVSTIVMCVAYPVLAWALDTWSLNIMQGYLETVCHVSIMGLGGPVDDALTSILKIVLYLSVPQLLIVVPFGVVFIALTKKNIKALKNELDVMFLSAQLEEENAHMKAMQDTILTSVAELVESRDGETGDHIKRMRKVTSILSNALKLDHYEGHDDQYFEMVEKAAPLHDIGKISIDDHILRKPGKLDEEEFEVIKTHPAKGAEIIGLVLGELEDPKFLQVASNIARYHHERYDGSGYPENKGGKEIPLEARIVAIADTYDAMVSERIYRPALDPRVVFEHIENQMGHHFDPELNKYFIACIPQIELYYQNANAEQE